jgi:hypothetical protein
MPTARVEEAASDSPDLVARVPEKRKWVSYIWDTFDKSPEERRLVFKLDSAILTFASLGELLSCFILRLMLTVIPGFRLLYQVP